MEVSLQELKSITEKILSKASSLGFDKICLDSDYYWCILPADRENFEKSPEPIVGSLADDFTSLKSLLNNDRDPNLIDFDRLAHLLITIGEKISKSDKPWLLSK